MADIAKFVELPGHGRSVEVEEALAPVVAEMLRAGVDVIAAERRPAGWFAIVFASPPDAVALLNAIARYVPDGDAFHARMRGDETNPRSWKYTVEPVLDAEMNVGFESLNWKPPTRFRLSVTVRCPQEDVAIMTELLRDFNGR